MLSEVIAGAGPSSLRNSPAWLPSLRSGQNFPPYFVQMAQIRAHDLKEWLYAFDGHTGMEQIALDPKGFQGFGLIPHQPPSDRGSIHIKSCHIGNSSPAAAGNVTGQTRADCRVLAGKAPDGLPAQTSMLVEGIERHVAHLHQRQHRAIADTRLFARLNSNPNDRYPDPHRLTHAR